MKVIDFEKKGNVIRFYLGEKTEEWGWTNPNYKTTNSSGEETVPDWLKPHDTYWGDDWDDYPYECNAGRVYGEFIKGYLDIALPFEAWVLEPSDDWRQSDSHFCKEDFVTRKVPCIVVLAPEQTKKYYSEPAYYEALGNDKARKIYFGDDEKDVLKIGLLLKYMRVDR